MTTAENEARATVGSDTDTDTDTGAEVELDPALLSVRADYDRVAPAYTDLLRDNLATNWANQAMLRLFADLVREAGPGPVADIGCGPGRITPYLAGLGLDVFGVDLSPGMIEVARREHPGLRFEVGSMTALGLGTHSLAGALGWYSLIHLPDHLVPVALAEFARVVRPGGYLMLAFQHGQQVRHIESAYGYDDLSLDLHRRTAEDFAPLLTEAGFEVFSSTVVAPSNGERESQAYVIARAVG
ncbi:methyltransferase [Kineosporia sp. NBRC 101677]|uniref:class I SAM-dependent methyltransferase n=1 Tax=Kineosporia sp. NBRC 101677 TaxID=3032197 RepID=UPI0024A20122|nr:class I SAM-dependent methyltransferase [Kineosporia sp. NBRC 101677]GLY19789.1 methyltransferase [Kineosporia sp. NBRC 101677]